MLFVVKKGSNTLSGSLSPDPRSEMEISTLAPHLLRPIEPIELTASACYGQLYEAYLRGLAYLRLNDGHSAALHFQKLIDHPGIVQGSIVGGLVHLQLARAEMLMGNKDAARKSYDDFLNLWKDADSDVPIYREAKAEYRRLLGED